MFLDYYKILGVDLKASADEIKKAYHQQSFRWHPDRNSGQDVTSMMQVINEAYAILKDPIKKNRYDAEYRRFKDAVLTPVKPQASPSCHADSTYSTNDFNDSSKQYDSYNYDVQDDNLKKDIEEARIYAKELVFQFMKSFAKSTSSAVVEGGKKALYFFIIYILAGLLLASLFAIF